MLAVQTVYYLNYSYLPWDPVGILRTLCLSIAINLFHIDAFDVSSINYFVAECVLVSVYSWDRIVNIFLFE